MDKCLHILPMSTLSGAEKMTLSLCKNLKEYEPIVICGGNPLKEVFEENEITTYSTSFDYKNIISLDLYTHLDYLDAIESKLIVPNESDTFIRTLKK